MDLSGSSVSSLSELKQGLGKYSIDEDFGGGLAVSYCRSDKFVRLYLEGDHCGSNHNLNDVTIPVDTFSQVLDMVIEECRKKFASTSVP